MVDRSTRDAAPRGLDAAERAIVQRKLGLELELPVLVDNNGKDAGTDTKLGKFDDNSRVTTDHNHDLKADKGRGSYTSIIELVTGAYEFEALSLVEVGHTIEQLRKDLFSAKEVAANLKSQTNNFTVPVALNAIIPNTLAGFNVGVSPGDLKQGTQSLDAYIQANFGADLANLGNLYGWASAGAFTPDGRLTGPSARG